MAATMRRNVLAEQVCPNICSYKLLISKYMEGYRTKVDAEANVDDSAHATTTRTIFCFRYTRNMRFKHLDQAMYILRYSYNQCQDSKR